MSQRRGTRRRATQGERMRRQWAREQAEQQAWWMCTECSREFATERGREGHRQFCQGQA